MRKSWWCVLLLLSACNQCRGGGDARRHAVGTYVGGGSVLFGADTCTYAGTPGVFHGDSATAQRGPRLVVGPGTITMTCGDSKTSLEAVAPTGAAISGPPTVTVGTSDAHYRAYLVAGGREIEGEAGIAWTLSSHCNGVAAFGPVLGSQDTGGADRTRTLVAQAPGKCQLTATLTTGSALDPSFAPQAFQADTLVEIKP